MLETVLALPTPSKQSKPLIEDALVKKKVLSMHSQLSEYQSELYLSRAKWTTPLTKIFADLLVEQIVQGNRPNSIFNKEGWAHVRNEFNKQTGLNFDRKQLKNHLDVLRKGYNNMKSLLDQSGFSWDESRNMVKADDEVWARYIKAHPEAETIRIKGCPIFKQLCRIFSESGDDLRDSLSNLQPATHQMGSQPYQHQSRQDQSKAKWTTSLDKIFTKLMVEQILQGNRPNNIFNKKAWKYIRDEFNKQTGLNFYKKQLKNHQNVLRRLYRSIKLLLDQNGFSWDETQCMVTAEDEVWKKYIKVHPEAETIRTKGCPIYKQLHRIFSESGPDGESALSDSEAAVQQVDSLPNQQQSKQDPSKAKWTISLDNILVDLLIEHKLGNKSTNVCYKKVWKYICDEFNKQTGLKFDEQQLRNHHSVLRRRFNNVKALLGQSGFSWDESRCMIMAKDEIWDNYIKAHPEAEAIRMKGCPIYKQLCTLFSESGVGSKNHEFELDEGRARTETPRSSAFPETASVSDKPEALPKSVQDEASSRSGEYMNTSDRRNKRRLVSPSSTPDHYKRMCEVVDHVLTDDVMLEMASASRIGTTTFPHSCDQFSISNCIKVLNEIKGVDQHLYLAALDVFEDPDRRETFISIKSDIRLAWLKGKCKVPS